MSAPDFARCARLLCDWYTTHYRPLPWRESADAYRVWISEIMLQQTRIEAVIPYYHRFLLACPDVYSLSRIPEEQLLKLWEGLGYYSRARNLQKAARVIVEEYGGELPREYAQLLSLPGVGEYTAGAIASIAYNMAVPAVDGNVMRVLARLTADETDVLSARAKKHFAEIARQMLPSEQAGRFNQAIMELGETVCLPNATPHCAACPLAEECLAHKEDKTHLLPIRAKKKARRIEERTVAIVRVEGDEPRVLLHKRPPEGLLADLWEFPNALSADLRDLLPKGIASICRRESPLGEAKHIFSHIEWRMNGELFTMPCVPLPSGYVAVTLSELSQEYALPTAFRAYSSQLPKLLLKEDK